MQMLVDGGGSHVKVLRRLLFTKKNYQTWVPFWSQKFLRNGSRFKNIVKKQNKNKTTEQNNRTTTERNGTEWNRMERNRTEQNKTKTNTVKSAILGEIPLEVGPNLQKIKLKKKNGKVSHFHFFSFGRKVLRYKW